VRIRGSEKLARRTFGSAAFFMDYVSSGACAAREPNGIGIACRRFVLHARMQLGEDKKPGDQAGNDIKN